jgi:hypothetical protein
VLIPTTPKAKRSTPPPIPIGVSVKSSSMMDTVHPQKKKGTSTASSATGRSQPTEQTGDEPEHATYVATPRHSAAPKSLLASVAFRARNSATARISAAVQAPVRRMSSRVVMVDAFWSVSSILEVQGCLLIVCDTQVWRRVESLCATPSKAYGLNASTETLLTPNFLLAPRALSEMN